MDVKNFIEPKELELDGTKFIISKMPAIQAQQIFGGIMKETKEDGDIAMIYLSTPIAVSLLSYTAVSFGDDWLVLDSETRINQQCRNLVTILKLEAAMIRYNFGFLFDGSLREVLEVLRSKEDI